MDKNSMMQKLAFAAFEKGVFNGAWLYAENGGIVSKGAFGFRDAEDKLPMTEDSVFEMASVTKMFTAAAIMLLVREGRLGLDDEYAKLFPDYPYEGVTIRHLLTHTSGMPDFDVEELVGPVLEEENRIPENSEIIDLIRKTGEGPACAPGEAFNYSDVNYMLLANAVEKVSSMRFEDFMKKNVFEPAGMKDSGIYHTRRDGRPSDRFTRNMVLEGGDNFVPSDVSELCRRYVVGSDGMNGCDYLYTTIFDMLAWDRALREEKVLTREEQRIMYTPVRLNRGEEYHDKDGEGYGFGWSIGSEPAPGAVVSHSGGMPGLETWFERSVDADRVLVLMSCRDYTDVRAFISFWEGMIAIAADREPEPFVTIEELAVKDPDKSKWPEFCGRYEHPEDAGFIVDEVFMKDDELYAHAIDEEDCPESIEQTFRLYPLGKNVFGRKDGLLELTFGDGCLMFDDFICKKR